MIVICGENVTHQYLLEKTFSNFHPSNMLKQQHYNKRFQEIITELISFCFCD